MKKLQRNNCLLDCTVSTASVFVFFCLLVGGGVRFVKGWGGPFLGEFRVTIRFDVVFSSDAYLSIKETR